MPRVKRSQQLPSIQTMQFVDDNDRHLANVDLGCFDADSVLKDMFPPTGDHVAVKVEGDEQEEEGEVDGDVDIKCPLCLDTLQYDEVETKQGVPWRYYRCPAVADFTKCFVACGVDDVSIYLERVKNTLHSIYRPGPVSFDPACMRCYCQLSLILALSRSDKNRHRLYFKCPKGRCSFFQWGDEEPKGKVYRWLYQGVATDAKGKEQRHKPYDLARPIERRPPFEARPRS